MVWSRVPLVDNAGGTRFLLLLPDGASPTTCVGAVEFLNTIWPTPFQGLGLLNLALRVLLPTPSDQSIDEV
jgi:hypothetical protein